MYLYTYINAHVQHFIYWQGQRDCDALFYMAYCQTINTYF
jgi:hypothetical protein